MDKILQRFTIGRDRSCDLPLADDSVSGLHAELALLVGQRLRVTDRDSTNGTWLRQLDGSEERLRSGWVSPNDELRFGEVTLTMHQILDALRLKEPRRLAGIGSATDRKVRCSCGWVRPQHGQCPGCGT